jgi:hypothetical protein
MFGARKVRRAALGGGAAGRNVEIDPACWAEQAAGEGGQIFPGRGVLASDRGA